MILRCWSRVSVFQCHQDHSMAHVRDSQPLIESMKCDNLTPVKVDFNRMWWRVKAWLCGKNAVVHLFRPQQLLLNCYKKRLQLTLSSMVSHRSSHRPHRTIKQFVHFSQFLASIAPSTQHCVYKLSRLKGKLCKCWFCLLSHLLGVRSSTSFACKSYADKIEESGQRRSFGAWMRTEKIIETKEIVRIRTNGGHDLDRRGRYCIARQKAANVFCVNKDIISWYRISV